jgi:hypothetical protein
MHKLTILLQLTLAVASIAATAVSVANAQRAAPGECGEYMYYQNGQCADARQKPGKDWTKGVTG